MKPNHDEIAAKKKLIRVALELHDGHAEPILVI